MTAEQVQAINEAARGKENINIILPPNCIASFSAGGYTNFLMEFTPRIHYVRWRLLKGERKLADDMGISYTKSGVAVLPLAMPYVYILLRYSMGYDGVPYNYGGMVFFRNSRIEKLTDRVHVAPLRNVWPTGEACIGDMDPNAPKQNNIQDAVNVSVKRWLEAFWGAIFNNSFPDNRYEVAKQTIPELENVMVWAKLSRTTPERVLEIPWAKMDGWEDERKDGLPLIDHAHRRPIAPDETDALSEKDIYTRVIRSWQQMEYRKRRNEVG